MRKWFLAGAFLLACGTLVMAVVVTLAAKAAAGSAFYQSAPAGWKDKPVGALLKYQRVQPSWPR